MYTTSYLRYCLFSVVVFGSSHCIADIYKWTDKEGNIHFSENPPKHIETAEKVILKKANIQQPIQKIDFGNQKPQQKQANDNDNVKAEAAFSKKKQESECQAVYGLSCYEVDNWRQAGIAHCKKNKGGDRCDNDKYIRSVYQPRTIKEKIRLGAQARAQRERREKESQRFREAQNK